MMNARRCTAAAPGPTAGALRRGSRGDGGYSVVEVVITFPVLMMMVMGVIQFALLWHGRHVAEAAAQGGLHSARAYSATADAGRLDTEAYLQQVAPNLLREPQVQVSRTSTTVTVTVRATVLSVVPLGLTVEETAVGPVERYVGPG